MKLWSVICDGEPTDWFVCAPDQETALKKVEDLVDAILLDGEYVWVEEATG